MRVPSFGVAMTLAVFSCGQKNVSPESDVKVIGGSRFLRETPVTAIVRKISAFYGTSDVSTCTATVVDSMHLLTASHCVVNESGKKALAVKIDGIGQVRSISIHPTVHVLKQKREKLEEQIEELAKKYPNIDQKLKHSELELALTPEEQQAKDKYLALQEESDKAMKEFAAADLAVLTLPTNLVEKTASMRFPAIATAKSDLKKETFLAVGFGFENLRSVKGELLFSAMGTKKWANVRPIEWNENVVTISHVLYKKKADKDDPGFVGPGDSGGPLLRCLDGKPIESCTETEIVGVWSYIEKKSSQAFGVINLEGNAASLVSETARNYLYEALAADRE